MRRNIFPLLVLISWIPGLTLLYPLPEGSVARETSGIVAKGMAQAGEVKTGVDERIVVRPGLAAWLNDALHVSVGIAAGVIGILGIQGWRLMALLAGIFSVALSWASTLENRIASSLLYFPSDSFVINVLQEKARFAQAVVSSNYLAVHKKFGVIYFECLMPVFQAVIVLALIIFMIRTFRRLSNNAREE